MQYISKLFSLTEQCRQGKYLLGKKALVSDLKITRVVALGKEVQEVGAERHFKLGGKCFQSGLLSHFKPLRSPQKRAQNVSLKDGDISNVHGAAACFWTCKGRECSCP